MFLARRFPQPMLGPAVIVAAPLSAQSVPTVPLSRPQAEGHRTDADELQYLQRFVRP